MEDKCRAVPVISVVTIYLNAYKNIERTIKSVLNQTYSHVEYIIVDGQSTDGTLEIINKYKDKLICVSEKDGGIANAMNKGLRLSSGDLIIYINAGDCLEEDTVLDRVVADYQINKWTWAIGSTRIVDLSGTEIGIQKISEYSAKRLRITNYICHPSAIVSRELLVAVGGFCEIYKVAMDYDLWLRLAKTTNGHVLPFIVSKFTIGGASSDSRHANSESRQVRLARLDRSCLQIATGEFFAFLWAITSNHKLTTFLNALLPKRLKAGLRRVRNRLLLP